MGIHGKASSENIEAAKRATDEIKSRFRTISPLVGSLSEGIQVVSPRVKQNECAALFDIPHALHERKRRTIKNYGVCSYASRAVLHDDIVLTTTR